MLATLLLLGEVYPASASLIEIEVTGVITESFESGVNGGRGAGFADGQTAVMRLYYDTAVAPDDLYGGSIPNNARYEAWYGPLACATAQGQYPGGSWINTSLTVDGTAVGGILPSGAYSNCDFIDKLNDSSFGYLVALDFAENFIANATQFLSESSRTELQLAAPGDWLDLALGSTFSIEPFFSSFFTVSAGNYGYEIDENGSSFNEFGTSVYYRALATLATARVIDDDNAVPEPSSLAVAALALLLLVLRPTVRQGALRSVGG
jgi:hypothetical protein